MQSVLGWTSVKREHYYQRLDELRRKANAQWSEMTVLGDIFELDLCVPLHLGARVGLMSSPFTPHYERSFLEQHPRGGVFDTLPQALEWVKQG